jgi:hypothetical protein
VPKWLGKEGNFRPSPTQDSVKLVPGFYTASMWERNYPTPHYHYYYHYHHEGLGAGGVKFAPGFIGFVQLFSALVSGVFQTV